VPSTGGRNRCRQGRFESSAEQLGTAAAPAGSRGRTQMQQPGEEWWSVRSFRSANSEYVAGGSDRAEEVRGDRLSARS